MHKKLFVITASCLFVSSAFAAEYTCKGSFPKEDGTYSQQSVEISIQGQYAVPVANPSVPELRAGDYQYDPKYKARTTEFDGWSDYKAMNGVAGSGDYQEILMSADRGSVVIRGPQMGSTGKLTCN